jgi:2-oxo-4-hydroxy-4-carboxy-5-ureidoimidazoline decarboxylase
MTLDELNRLDRAAFVNFLGGVYEHSPWVAEQAWIRRPFRHVAALHKAMVAFMRAAPRDWKLELIRAHAELAGQATRDGRLSRAATREQQSAGLDQCTPEEIERFAALNQAYREKFGFPFVLAVKGRTRATVLQVFEQRLENTPEEEFEMALRQIEQIAWLRLVEMLAAE